MNIDFNGDKEKTKMSKGDYAEMIAMRKKTLPEIQKNVQEMFKDYDGGAMCIVIMKEDENGMPVGRSVLMGGVARPEVQIMLGKYLNDASTKAIDLLIEEAKKDPEHMLKLADSLLDFMKDLTEKK